MVQVRTTKKKIPSALATHNYPEQRALFASQHDAEVALGDKVATEPAHVYLVILPAHCKAMEFLESCLSIVILHNEVIEDKRCLAFWDAREVTESVAINSTVGHLVTFAEWIYIQRLTKESWEANLSTKNLSPLPVFPSSPRTG